MVENLRRLNLIVPGVIDQAIRVAEHTVLPIEYACQVVYFGAAQLGMLPDAVYEDAISQASARWGIGASDKILSDTLTILHYTLP